MPMTNFAPPLLPGLLSGWAGARYPVFASPHQPHGPVPFAHVTDAPVTFVVFSVFPEPLLEHAATAMSINAVIATDIRVFISLLPFVPSHHAGDQLLLDLVEMLFDRGDRTVGVAFEDRVGDLVVRLRGVEDHLLDEPDV